MSNEKKNNLSLRNRKVAGVHQHNNNKVLAVLFQLRKTRRIISSIHLQSLDPDQMFLWFPHIPLLIHVWLQLSRPVILQKDVKTEEVKGMR